MPEWNDELYLIHRKDYDERIAALVGSGFNSDEQADALINALEDALDKLDA